MLRIFHADVFPLRYFDHYCLLNVGEHATPGEITRAYEIAVASLPKDFKARLVAQLVGRTAQRFHHAHEELSDPDRRAEYDAYRAHARTILLASFH